MKNLFIAYAIIWIGLFFYLLKLHSRVSRLEKELKEIEEEKKS